MTTLLSFGHGYSARALAPLLPGWRVVGTTRSPGKAEALRAEGVEPVPWGDPVPLAEATHVMTSAPPGDDGDPVLATYDDALRAHLRPGQWVGYLSTTGVYGDRAGGWVDEDSPLAPATARGRARVEAEAAWARLARETGAWLHVFRLAGIYGPGRGPFAKVRAGTARRIVKPGQVFSRVHRDDIAAALAASVARPHPGGRVYNLCDDDPAPPQDVIAHAADLLGLPRPPEVAYAEADLSPMARSFYAESKRVRNHRLKRELGVALRHPTYRQGLASLLDDPNDVGG